MKSLLTVSRAAFAALTLLGVAQAQYVEQPPRLVGNGVAGTSNQGHSVSLSADGNTALTGGPADNGQNGAAWVFVRTAGWTQQGNKLVGSGAVGSTPAQQGASVAFSADGNTAAVGGPGDNNGAGAVWVFRRSGGVWTQQVKLTVSDAIGNAALGSSVSVSSDGNTVIAGGPGDNSGAGAAWVFDTYNGPALIPIRFTVKLVGIGAIGNAQQGYSVALSSDATTALVGGPGDSGKAGAVWVFTPSGGGWSQQGMKLVGMGAVGNTQQGFAVALSGDGNTALEGGPGDTTNNGAAWVFTRSAGAWTQQGNKLVGSDLSRTGSQQGASVALTADGNRAIIGAPGWESGLVGKLPSGAAWVYARKGGIWSQLGLLQSTYSMDSEMAGTSAAISATGNTALLGAPSYSGTSATGAAFAFIWPQLRDFNADGRADVLLYDPVSGTSYTALSNGNGTYSYVYNLFTPAFDTLRVCDLNGDLKDDLILYNTHTALGYAGLGNGDGTFAFQSLFWSPGYDVVKCGYFANGASVHGPTSDVVLYNSSTGALVAAVSNGDGTFTYQPQTQYPSYVAFGPGFTLIGIAHFEVVNFVMAAPADQLLFYNPTNGMIYLAYYDYEGVVPFHFQPVGVSPGLSGISPGYDLADIADINGDGYADLILYNSANGNAATGISNGTGAFTFTAHLYSPGFTSVRLADFTGDGKADLILYNKNTGIGYFGTGDGTGNFSFQSLFWSPGYDSVIAEDVNGDNKADFLLYNSATGTLYTGISNGDGTFDYTYSYWGIGKLLAQ